MASPKLHYLKKIYINVNASVKVGHGTSGLGIVVRNGNGEVAYVVAKKIKQESFPLIAELHAIREGLQIGITRRLQRFQVESDCQQAINLICNQGDACHDCDGLL
uniref:RNase H type-1 domain-containing protein n=1 Tax=Cannabis sativa TaxID=3483 RepID=A0A803PBH9_CANSA